MPDILREKQTTHAGRIYPHQLDVQLYQTALALRTKRKGMQNANAAFQFEISRIEQQIKAIQQEQAQFNRYLSLRGQP